LGKSTLVQKIFASAASQGDYITPQIRIPLHSDPLKALSAALLGLADQSGAVRDRKLRDLLARIRSVSAKGVSLTMERAVGPEPHVDLTSLLIAIGKAAMRENRAVLIHIDEVQNITDEGALSQMLIALGDAIEHEVTVELPGNFKVKKCLPIAVFLTGLPDFEDLAGARRGATFARRFQTSTLAPIAEADFEVALSQFLDPGWPVLDAQGNQTFVRMEPKAAKLIAELSCGEPFLFQLAGEKAWYQGTGSEITEADVREGWEQAQSEAENHVERTLRRLPDREREFILKMAALPAEERSAKNIAQALGMATSAGIGSTAQRLDTTRRIIKRGDIYQFRNHALEAYPTSNWPDIS